MEVKITKLNSIDLDLFMQLIRVFEKVFEMDKLNIPGNQHLQGLLDNPDFHVFVALVDNTVIGGLTVYTLQQYYSEKPLAYIYDLAVMTDYQRQGVGRKLVKAVIDFGADNGYEEVFVQADKVDDYAIDFYRSTSITNEEQVVHFYYKL